MPGFYLNRNQSNNFNNVFNSRRQNNMPQRSPFGWFMPHNQPQHLANRQQINTPTAPVQDPNVKFEPIDPAMLKKLQEAAAKEDAEIMKDKAVIENPPLLNIATITP